MLDNKNKNKPIIILKYLINSTIISVSIFPYFLLIFILIPWINSKTNVNLNRTIMGLWQLPIGALILFALFGPSINKKLINNSGIKNYIYLYSKKIFWAGIVLSIFIGFINIFFKKGIVANIFIFIIIFLFSIFNIVFYYSMVSLTKIIMRKIDKNETHSELN